MEFKDYCLVMGVEKSATPEDIKRTHCKLARKYHPDVAMVATEFATKYIFTRTLNTSSGRQPLPVITAIWQKDIGKDGVGFLTAYPGEKVKMLKEYS